ncbi:DNA-formamidopyrimidine glycosylase [Candidatus Methanomassiliicoccus intestinalis]|mgnify:FL=1|jgi:DNA-formamidopyrimidine glycosylase|uniref:DNA-formamidopyrimidine glycosylase n=1 Tax=Candidatus Methanomassiliicoccus intestinalis TaxID=1406512 RepID=A0A8J8TE42_9ARCH|nr:MAG: DNA-formamidopyrimidine glycosylase [Candidatus Methanomassiliicoccus intestinalis]
MPELPEVETVVNVLKPQIIDLTVSRITINKPQVIAYPAVEEFCTRLTGQKISGMKRRGKFIIICFASGDQLILHLRMTGCLLVTPAEDNIADHTHVIFELENNTQLRFIDTRRFGRFWMIKKGEEDNVSGINKLGIEPFDAVLTADYLQSILSNRKKTIKECLLDQSLIAGIGNIYSDEILFRANIDPMRKANTLNSCELERLAAEIPRTLEYYMEKNEITPEEYLKKQGRGYNNSSFLNVYGQDNKLCPVCGEILHRRVIGGRSSVYCQNCQK